jgi:MFS family permease
MLPEYYRSSGLTWTPYSKYGLQNLEKGPKADLSANIASTLQAGCFIGCFLSSWVADRWGRKTALMFNGLLTIVGCIIQACSFGSLPSMYVGRYVYVLRRIPVWPHAYKL